MPIVTMEVEGKLVETFYYSLSEQSERYFRKAEAAEAEAEAARADAETARAEADEYRKQVGTARDEGKAEGRAEAEAECASKHFVTSAVGDGKNYIEFDAPDFEPDAITIYPADLAAVEASNIHSIVHMCITPNSTGSYGMGGTALYINGETVQLVRLAGGASADSVKKIYLVEDGKIKIGKRANDDKSTGIPVSASGTTTAKFISGQAYVLAAIKHT